MINSNTNKKSHHILGIPASSGIEVANVLRIDKKIHTSKLDNKNIEIIPTDEVNKFHIAISRLKLDLVSTKNNFSESGNESDIFLAMIMILEDSSFIPKIISEIETNNINANNSVINNCNNLASLFENLKDVTMRSKAEDIHFLKDKLCFYINNELQQMLDCKGKIVVAEQISPLDSAKFASEGAVGFITKFGGINSHTAIIARSFGIPMLCGLQEFSLIENDMLIALDGFKGELITYPDKEVLDEYTQRKNIIDEHKKIAYQMRELPTQTLDGVKITLCANIDTLEDIDFAIANGAEEVGLLRTEYLLLGKGEPVSADEQYEYYSKVAERAYPMPVTLRVFDIGGDKIPAKNFGADDSPLGMRGIRLLFNKKELLHDQLEAILRASSIKNLRVMIPMVTSDEQIWKVKEMIKSIRAELIEKGISVDRFLPGGAMIETPSAALVADSLAVESDFLSIGTNDLTQYTLAVDRNDIELAEYYDEFHPAVLKLIKMSVEAGKKANIPVTLCGELAGNLQATKILIGLGINKFSVSPTIIPQLKMRIREIDFKFAEEVALRAISSSDGIAVRKLIASTH